MLGYACGLRHAGARASATSRRAGGRAAVARAHALSSAGVERPAQDPVVAALSRRLGAASTAGVAAAAGFVARARQAWPELPSVDPEVLADCVEPRVADRDDVAAALAELDAGELWLCAACAGGSRAAQACFETHYVSGLDLALRTMSLRPHELDEVKQRVRDKLLGTDADGRPRLLAYAGGGRLRGLVKVVGMRAALDDIRARRRRPDLGGAADASTVDRLMAGDLGPELRVVERQHQALVKAAFHDAIEALPSIDRGILRLHLLERVGIDEIAALHDVHRATAARWLGRIRQHLGEHTRERLRARLRLDAAELDSLLRAVDSRIDLSLSRVLAGPADGGGERP
jgi:RNA polymerase sigma-70 factor, ECF subfamily